MKFILRAESDDKTVEFTLDNEELNSPAYLEIAIEGVNGSYLLDATELWLAVSCFYRQARDYNEPKSVV